MVQRGHLLDVVDLVVAERISVLTVASNSLAASSSRRFLPPQQLQQVFQDAGVDLGKPVVASCGTGVTASVLALALEQLPQPPPSVAVYDGSWTEWGAREDLPKATGKA
jgi:thiosulfate/3-mercaptopyruvate sulfurtransferase